MQAVMNGQIIITRITIDDDDDYQRMQARCTHGRAVGQRLARIDPSIDVCPGYTRRQHHHHRSSFFDIDIHSKISVNQIN